MIELQDFLGVAGFPAVAALVAATVAVFPDIESRWKPALAFGWAAVINAIVAVGMWSVGTPINWAVIVIAWILCGLAASGFYSQGKAASGN